MGTFLLALFAFVGTIMVIFDPSPKLFKWIQGKKDSELKEEIELALDSDRSLVWRKGCGLVSFLVVNLSYAFVIEPLYVLSALSAKVGNQPIAYVTLLIIGISWVRLVRNFTKKEKKQGNVLVITSEGKKVEGAIIEVDKENQLGNPVWFHTRRFFFALPEVYLWYLLLVAIHVVS